MINKFFEYEIREEFKEFNFSKRNTAIFIRNTNEIELCDYSFACALYCVIFCISICSDDKFQTLTRTIEVVEMTKSSFFVRYIIQYF